MKFIERDGYISIVLDDESVVNFSKSVALKVANRLIDYAASGKNEPPNINKKIIKTTSDHTQHAGGRPHR